MRTKLELPSFPKVDKRLLGTWKSDARRTLKDWRWKKSLSPKRIKKCKTIFGKSEAIFTKTKVISRLSHRNWESARRYAVLGVDKNHPSSVVNVYAPVSGVIIGQNVTNAAAAGVTLSGSATAFTIADLSNVWILCDVYENDIPRIKVGQAAAIKLNAYPDRIITGHISDIGPVLDPSIRTAKVRIEVPNPGILKLGMFVSATFTSGTKRTFAAIPSSAILHLHDRDWVFIRLDGNRFQRVEVEAGDLLPGNKQQILSGVEPGQKVVSNVLALEETLEAAQ